VEAWKEIFRMADERYEVRRVNADPLSFVSNVYVRTACETYADFVHRRLDVCA